MLYILSPQGSILDNNDEGNSINIEDNNVAEAAKKEAFKKGFNKILPNSHLFWSMFFNKVARHRPSILLQNTLQHSCFPVNFAKFLITPFLQNTNK